MMLDANRPKSKFHSIPPSLTHDLCCCWMHSCGQHANHPNKKTHCISPVLFVIGAAAGCGLADAHAHAH